MVTLKKTASFIDVATAIYPAYIICKSNNKGIAAARRNRNVLEKYNTKRGFKSS